MMKKKVHNKTQECSIESFNGTFSVVAGLEDDYPGVDVEFIMKDKNVKTMPRILFEELPEPEGTLRVLIWGDPYSEDPTFEYKFNPNLPNKNRFARRKKK